MFNKDKKDRDLEIRENDSKNIFTGSIYHGKDDPRYNTLVSDANLDQVIPLVQERARQDGQWCIDMDLVGNNEDKMRRMILFCSDEMNITDCYHYITHHEDPTTRDIDFICRDLANASKGLSK